mmetsp:Transcript_12855/g.22878  ORF Transcript_12855/g.22878 Transcript_12855/m.22878 type:complete len:206 (-) Transcript_12855:588-1205(-)
MRSPFRLYRHLLAVPPLLLRTAPAAPAATPLPARMHLPQKFLWFNLETSSALLMGNCRWILPTPRPLTLLAATRPVQSMVAYLIASPATVSTLSKGSQRRLRDMLLSAWLRNTCGRNICRTPVARAPRNRLPPATIKIAQTHLPVIRIVGCTPPRCFPFFLSSGTRLPLAVSVTKACPATSAASSPNSILSPRQILRSRTPCRAS